MQWHKISTVFELALEITQTVTFTNIKFIISRMNLRVLRFGHLIAPFKERVFNRKTHNLVKLLAHKNKQTKPSKKKNKKSNPQVSHN